jgi:hypothetical protein
MPSESEYKDGNFEHFELGVEASSRERGYKGSGDLAFQIARTFESLRGAYRMRKCLRVFTDPANVA